MVTGVSSLSIGNVYPATLTPATHDSGVTWDANIDSGASISASGRSNLFPPKLITKWHPKFSVRSASRQVMPVLFIGSMLLKPAGINNKKNKGLIVENALYVPDMKELTLISPKQLFRSHGIRTYFNDENYLKLPDGATVEFTETSKSYILKIEPLDDELRKFDASNASEFASAEFSRGASLSHQLNLPQSSSTAAAATSRLIASLIHCPMSKASARYLVFTATTAYVGA